jgi:membrane associated rhomboid family serine protease
MIFLLVFGDNIEDALGSFRFVLFYLACGIVGALAYVASDPHSQVPLIGASGAVSGVVAAYLMVRPCAKITILFVVVPMQVAAYWVVGSFIVFQVYHVGIGTHDGVAYWTHVGGIAAGAALFPLLRRPHVKLFQCIRLRT